MTVYESLIENFKDIQTMLKDHERILSSPGSVNKYK